MRRYSVAMTCSVDDYLSGHLLRTDGQEDICLATYSMSTGRERTTFILRDIHLPQPGERRVHRNASFTGDYILRVATDAAEHNQGVVILHSHPHGQGWQGMSTHDHDAEQSYSRVVEAVTGHPLVGMTLAGDGSWSARAWSENGVPVWCESVRTIGDHLTVSWNDTVRRPPPLQNSQQRTVSSWGPRRQRDLARLRVLVVGAGSVGLDVALRLAATGIVHVAVMDFDDVESVNLDRLIGATRQDVRLRRSKTEVAVRLLRQSATAASPDVAGYEISICEPAGHTTALDYDVIFSCVDRPWPRAVLNATAYADLIPVIDGGIAIDAFTDGEGMRNATVRTHVVRPGRPCLTCTKQLDQGAASTDKAGLLDDPNYIAGATPDLVPQGQNVAALSATVSASLLAQFISLTVVPGGQGDPGPLRFSLATHHLEVLPTVGNPQCVTEAVVGRGDGRTPLTGPHVAAEAGIHARKRAHKNWRTRLLRSAVKLLHTAENKVVG